MPELICKKCGSVNDYTTELKANNLVATCNCGAFIKNLPWQPPALYFGRYKGREISSMRSNDEIKYLQWLADQTFCKKPLKEQINSHLLSI